MEPVYRNIEFCRDPTTLWGKMREGRWDWLGVHPKSGFVLGSPPAARISDHAAVTARTGGSVDGEHGVRLRDEPGARGAASEFWFPTQAEAEAKFAEIVATFADREGPLMALVERIEGQTVVEDRVILDKTSTYDWRPPPGVG